MNYLGCIFPKGFSPLFYLDAHFVCISLILILCTDNSVSGNPFFVEAAFQHPQMLSQKLSPGTLVLCSPFSQKDYKKEDPFIYKVSQILNSKTCRIKGIMMFGTLGGKYTSGEEMCSNSCTANINFEKILAVMSWDLRGNMPENIADRIREIY